MQLQFLVFTIKIERRSRENIIRSERHYQKAAEQIRAQKDKYFYY